MVLNKIDERLKRLLGLVENWKSSGSVPHIERDIALEELRRLYEELLASPSAVEPVALESVEHVAEVVNETENMIAEPEEVVAPAPTPAPAPAPEVEDEPVVVATKHEDMGEAFDDALDIAALLGLSGDDTIEEAERVIEQSREQEAVVEESAPIAEESVAEAPAIEEVAEEAAVEAKEEKLVAEESKPAERAANGGLFDIDDIPVRTKRGRKMISLYNDDVMPVSAPAPEPEPEEVVEPVVEVPAPAPMPAPTPAPAPMPAPAPAPAPQRLGDVIAKNVTVLGDKMAEEQPTAAFNRITDIRKAIGLNDKFLMIRDLFGGDANLYEDTINHLNEFDDLDECMIFIVENFRWNPDSEGAKLLVSLIERKLS
ncbi:MAG: hypothetical protein J6Q21_01110 [Alistipes sp.]|nr:hypothetical protein [Alistipes sp.]